MFRGLPITRMTEHLLEDLRLFVEAEAPLFDGDFDQALASILRAKCSFASGDPGNTGEIGDIYRIPPKLWLVRNKVGGWTAMYPEDYLLGNVRIKPLSLLAFSTWPNATAVLQLFFVVRPRKASVSAASVSPGYRNQSARRSSQ
jgi:hypothetical protein